jgi:hypothetical protein
LRKPRFLSGTPHIRSYYRTPIQHARRERRRAYIL